MSFVRSIRPISSEAERIAEHTQRLRAVQRGSEQHQLASSLKEINELNLSRRGEQRRYTAFVAAGSLAGAAAAFVLGWQPTFIDVTAESMADFGTLLSYAGAGFRQAGQWIRFLDQHLYAPLVVPTAAAIFITAAIVAAWAVRRLNAVRPAIIMIASWAVLSAPLGAPKALAIGLGGAAGHYAHALYKDVRGGFRLARTVRKIARLPGQAVRAICNPRASYRNLQHRRQARRALRRELKRLEL
jgi:hypothetical protein